MTYSTALRYVRAWGAILATALLASCATMTPEECKVANWSEVGLRDGLRGAAPSVLDDRVKDCAEAKVPVDTRSYFQGRAQGLQSYCRIENAAGYGLDGKTYCGVCPATMDSEFRRRFEMGSQVRQRRADVQTLDTRLEPLEKSLKDAKNDDERKKIREELRDLDRDLRRARDRLREAEWSLGQLR